MNAFGSPRFRDEILLAARILLVVLFLVFGWMKLNDYSGTVGYLTQIGAPLPPLAALVAILFEVFGSIAIVLGAWTRPAAALLAAYTLATALIGHRYWTMTGSDQFIAESNFYKNISIVAGFMLLWITGAGRYSIDSLLAARSVSQTSGEFRSS